MATSNVTVKIDGLDELRGLIERLELLMNKVDALGRPLFGTVHVHASGEPE